MTRFRMAIAAGTALVACARTPPVPHTVLDESLDALRTAFDADSGKVRAIFLASPT